MDSACQYLSAFVETLTYSSFLGPDRRLFGIFLFEIHAILYISRPQRIDDMKFVVIVSCNDYILIEWCELKLIFYTVIFEKMAHFFPHAGVDLDNRNRLRGSTQVPDFHSEIIPGNNIFARCQKLQRVNFISHFPKTVVRIFCLFLEKILSVFTVVQGGP